MAQARVVKRILITTFLFVLAGAVAGIVVAFASLAPVWLGMTPVSAAALIDPWIFGTIAVMGAICGAVVMPVFGWFIIDRAGFWRTVLEPTLVAIFCTMLGSIVFRSLQTDVLIYGAFLGAMLATARLRFSPKPGIESAA